MPLNVLKRIVRRLQPKSTAPAFRGAFTTYAEAMAAVKPSKLAGYDHEEIADISFERMCQIQLWDYPVLFWLNQLAADAPALIDAGGHMGTKYRAFRNHLALPDSFDWAVYDVPAIVRAGRARAEADGLLGISFHERLEETPAADILLCSGLLQYLDIPFQDLIDRLPQKPRHLILNKVATRDGPTIVTLEDFNTAEVPYQIRDHAGFVASLEALGYDLIDTWVIPELSRSHPAFGSSVSRGFYARQR
ncbi:MAG: methyltransferase, TIGR04325 family [Hyphomonadaceae bacterium]